MRRVDRYQLLRVVRVDHDRRRTLVLDRAGVGRGERIDPSAELVAPPLGALPACARSMGTGAFGSWAIAGSMASSTRDSSDSRASVRRRAFRNAAARAHPTLAAALSEPDLGRDRAHYRFSAIIASP